MNNNVEQDKKELEEFLKYLNKKELEKYIKQDNIFSILKLVKVEIRHSLMLAYLFDPNESHGLGADVLKKFIQELRTSYIIKEKLKNFKNLHHKSFRVFTEYKHIDILIKSDQDKKIFCIENKILSEDHDKQLSRYYETIKEEFKGYETIYLYLTPLGKDPQEDEESNWYCISYKNIIKVLENVSLKNCNNKIRYLIKDYKEIIRRNIIIDKELRKKCMEIYLKHRRAIDLLNEILDTRYYVRNIITKYLTNEKEKSKKGINFLDKFSTHINLFFTTKTLEKNFPEKKPDKNPYNYYQIWIGKDQIIIYFICEYKNDNERQKQYDAAKEYIKNVWKKKLTFISNQIAKIDIEDLTMYEENDEKKLTDEMDKIIKKL